MGLKLEDATPGMMVQQVEGEWVTFCRRTEDPKLRYIEVLLDEWGIHHRRHGYSAHAPILQVTKDKEDDAWGLLCTVMDRDEDGNPITLDDMPDDDPMFAED